MVTAAQHYIFEILIEKVPKCVRPECDQLYDQCVNLIGGAIKVNLKSEVV